MKILGVQTLCVFQDLLLNILPAKVIEQLQTRGPSATDVFSSLRESRHPWSAPSIAESFHRASILFVDIKNFTRWSATMGPEELVGKLSMIVSRRLVIWRSVAWLELKLGEIEACVSPARVESGPWLVCAESPVRFC